MLFVYKTYTIDYDYHFNNKDNTILFLHGWQGDKNSFISSIKFFNHQYNTLSISMPPYKDSIIPLTMDDYKNIVYTILKLLNLTHIIIICHSFGFRVALMLASTDIGISKIIITGGAGIKLKPHFFKKLTSQFNQILLLTHPEYYSQIASSDYRDLSTIDKITFKNIVNKDLTNYLPLLNCPAFLFWGNNDTSTHVKITRIFKTFHPNCKIKIIKNGSHFCYLEHSQLFIDCCNKFLHQ